MFLLTFLVVNMADTKRKLENDIFAAAGIAQKYNCALTRLDYQQEAGLMSSVPLGENLIPIQRGLTTSSTAIFIPFITQELFQTGAALYYGLNALSNNMILCDRKQLKNPNGLILGTPGSGKSFAAKREITNAFLITDDDIFICDPEAEYFALVKRLGGQVIRLSPTGKGMDGTPQYVNPMDMNLNYSEDDSPLALKSDFILSLCELVIGGKEGFLNHIQFAGHIYLSSFSTSEISFAVAVTIRMPLSLISSRRASSCRRFVSFWVGVSKRNWSTDIL